MKKSISFVLSIALLLIMLTGCGNITIFGGGGFSEGVELFGFIPVILVTISVFAWIASGIGFIVSLVIYLLTKSSIAQKAFIVLAIVGVLSFVVIIVLGLTLFNDVRILTQSHLTG